jgi:hypothetical protein
MTPPSLDVTLGNACPYLASYTDDSHKEMHESNTVRLRLVRQERAKIRNAPIRFRRDTAYFARLPATALTLGVQTL